MRMGSRIKKIREFRKLTQKELGVKCGFNEDNADVRIRQYESSTKMPRNDNLKILSDVLNISYAVLMPDSIYEEFFENLLWAEEEFGRIDVFSFDEVNEPPRNCVEDEWKYKAIYNKYDSTKWISNVPVGTAFNNSLINEFLNEWLEIKKEVMQGIISEDEYFEWKINWPHSKEK